MALKPADLQWSDDGSLVSRDFDDVYFQHHKGPEESYYVFLEQNRLAERFAGARGAFNIAELGFGTGLNFLLTAKLWAEKAPPAARLNYVSAEKHPIPLADLRRVMGFWPDLQKFSGPVTAQYPPMVEGFHRLHLGNIHLTLLFGDAADMLPELSGKFDAWYLDGFSPAKNPGMWDEKFFPLIASRTKAGGTLATFSSAGFVRRGLKDAGFDVKKIKGFGFKWSSTVAEMPGAEAPCVHKNIAVLGAGIAGASTAYALARKGFNVTIYDRQQSAAMETSGNPLGILYPKLTAAPSPRGMFNQHGFCYSTALLKALQLPSWNACGVLHMDTNEEDRQRHMQMAASGQWPEDFTAYDQGLWQAAAGYLSPPEFCNAMIRAAGIKTEYSHTLQQLPEGYDAVVIALGHGSKSFSETSWLPLQSLRGQITYLKPTTSSGAIDQVFCHDGYVTPAIDGLHYAGATFQKEEPETPELRDADHVENLKKLNTHLPQFEFTTAHIAGGRTGYRTTTPDKLPMIGRLPDYDKFTADFAGLRTGKKITGAGAFVDNVYLSTGFGAHGLSGAPLAGEIIASLISGDPLPIPQSLMEHLAPERFILRDLKRQKI